MKKFVAAALAACMLFAFGGVALAETGSSTYSLDARMQIGIPDDYTVVTRDTKELPETLAETGMTIGELLSTYQSENIFLEAFDADVNAQILVTMQDSGQQDMRDLGSLSGSDLDAYAKNMVEQLNKNNTSTIDGETVVTKYGDFSICRYGDATYILTPVEKTYQSTGETRESVEYYTVKNGAAITITENSLTGTLTDEQKTALDGMVQSAQYTDAVFLNLSVMQLALIGAGVVALIVLVAVLAAKRRINRNRG